MSKRSKKTKIQFVICMLLPSGLIIEETIKLLCSQNKTLLTYVFVIIYINLFILNIYAIKIIIGKQKDKNRQKRMFYKILTPAAFMLYFLLGGLLILVAFIVVFLLAYFIISTILVFIPFIKLENSIPIIFLSSVTGLCVLSYFDEDIMNYIVKQLNFPKRESKKIYELGINSIRIISPRKLMYFLSILFYILVYITEQNGGKIIGLEWWNDISKFAEAILITFVAIDAYLEHSKPKFIEKLEKKLPFTE